MLRRARIAVAHWYVRTRLRWSGRCSDCGDALVYAAMNDPEIYCVACAWSEAELSRWPGRVAAIVCGVLLLILVIGGAR